MKLFDELKIGNKMLKNRVIMAPMTRNRAPDNIPNKMMAQYYSQRASAGLIITEATQVSPMGIGYVRTPGIHSQEQIDGWREITSSVHKEGGLIFCQLWHVGRVSHSSFLSGNLPLAPSAIKLKGKHFTEKGYQEYETPKELSINEIKEIVSQYAQAAKNAMKAGFDGVEIHGANGYLIDQFLKDGSNKREDEYGGTIVNRSKFLFEIIEAVSSEIGSQKVGVRFSPSGVFNDARDSSPEHHFRYIFSKLNSYNLAYLHIVKALESDITYGGINVDLNAFRDVYKGVLIANGRFTKESGNELLERSGADAIAYGSLYTSNPDLVERFKMDAPLVEPNPKTFYSAGKRGYIDYEKLELEYTI